MTFERPMLTLEAIDRKLEGRREPRRTYLGISYAGEKCDRKIWLTFRWARAEKLSGRMMRLFSRGQREEAVVVRLLRSVGVNVTETGKKQRTVVLSPWVKGHCDGIIRSGLKESATNVHIFECKTANDRAFQDLVKRGMQAAKPMHYTQTQLYMLGTDIGRTFYWCTNKNDDEVYTERTKLDTAFAEKARDRVVALSTEKNLPAPLSVMPSWYECKMCPMWGICHNHEAADRSCRTCEHGIFNEDGTFTCNKDGRELSSRMQEKACRDYKMHYDLEALCSR